MNPLVAAIYNDFTQDKDKSKVTEPDILANGKKDWSRYNATVVGAVWVPNQPSNPGGLPGIDRTRSIPYRNVSFAAKREYGPNEGWIHVGKRGRTWRPRYVDHEPAGEE
jgi:hypothetical protein